MNWPHLYVSGQSGSGKSTYLKNDALHRIHDGDGLLYLDLHGPDADDLIDRIPDHRRADTFLFDLTTFPLALNPLADVPQEMRAFTATVLSDIIRIIAGYDEFATPRITNNVLFSALALMEHGGTLADIPRLLTDTTITIPRPQKPKSPKRVLYRHTVTDGITDQFEKDYWAQFENRSGKERREYIDSTLSQFYVLFSDKRLRQAFGQRQSSFSVSDILDNNQIFIARLPQGQLGLSRARAVASLLLSMFHVSALGRSSRLPFHFYLDEGHHLPAGVVMEMLSGIRKFGCRVVYSHQYVRQVPPAVFDALMANCGLKHVFRTSRQDAARFENERPQNDALFNLFELPPFAYRAFSFAEKPVDATVSPLAWPCWPENRRMIESNMRRNYVK